MDCKTFRERITALCDKDAPAAWDAECREHAESCPTCRRYRKEFMAAVDALTPRHPLPEAAARPDGARAGWPGKRRLMRAAAVFAAFALGVFAGLNHLFVSEAEARKVQVFTRAIDVGSHTGNYVIRMDVRTSPGENFAEMNPEAGFTGLTLQVLRRNGETLWRIEKEGGRTVLFDGKEQYMWTADGSLHMRGPEDWNFIEGFTALLYPERLLRLQQEYLAHGKKTDITTKETGGTTLVTLATEAPESFPQRQSAKGRRPRLVIENEFGRTDGLLHAVRLWTESEGKRILLMRSREIRYNTDLAKEELLDRPAPAGGWQSVSPAPVEGRERLAFLQRETPTEAARRIVGALISGRHEKAREALYYYRPQLEKITQSLAGCRADGFGEPRWPDDYAGVYVFYTLTLPDGSTETRHVALRNDNGQKIWMLDGGI